MKINPNIFRAYDIRGVVGEDITTDTAERIGYAYGTYLSEINPGKSLHVVVGRDNRTHGAKLSEAFRRGVVASGVSAFDLGESPSPFLYYTVIAGDYDGGVNITASHNPSHYNGFKMVREGAHSICGEEIQKIREIAERDFDRADNSGAPVEEDYWSMYSQTLLGKINFKKKLKVVVDNAGGVSTGRYTEVIKKAGAEVIELYPEANGEFPYHSPDPLVEDNLADLKERVKSENADLGVAFDGDGDRVFVITGTGQFIDANQMMILLAKHILSEGDTLVYTVSCSSVIEEEMQKLGIKSEMVPVGHSFVESKMRELGALLGAEQSGHFFVQKNYYSYDDALFTALNILEMVSQNEKSLDEMVMEIPKRVAAPERRLTCPDDHKFEIVDSITNDFSEYNYRCTTMDGVRVDMPDGSWIGVRASNTSPCISVICEATSPTRLAEIEKEVDEILKKYPEIELN